METIVALMQEQGVSQRELALRLDRSEPWVSRVLNGKHNTTLKTIADLGWALGLRFELAPHAIARSGAAAEGTPRLPAWVKRHGRQAAR